MIVRYDALMQKELSTYFEKFFLRLLIESEFKRFPSKKNESSRKNNVSLKGKVPKVFNKACRAVVRYTSVPSPLV